MKLLVTLVAVLSLVGCASFSDIENLQTQVDALTVSVKETQDAAASAKQSSQDAAMAAAAAEKSAAEVNAKMNSMLDKTFTQHMKK